MERNDLLYITLNRIWCNNLKDNSKVIIVVMNAQQLLLKSSVKSIKNGNAYFYRQSFQVPFTPELRFEIKDLPNNSSLTYLPLSSLLKQLKLSTKNVFQSTSEGYKLLWEVQIDNGCTDKKGQLTQRELFDSNDDFVPIGGALSYLQPATKIRQKRRLSAKTKDNSDAISQPSQSYEKLVELNNFHKKVSIDFQTVHNCEPTVKIKQNQIRFVKQEYQKDLKLSQRVPKMQQSANVKLTVQSCLVFQSPNKNLCRNKIQKSPQHNIKRCRSSFLTRLGVKEMISSAVLGIVSGLAATQF